MKTIIKSNGVRYISQIPEFKEGLPFGILNKKVTDAGGTFCAIDCENVNYIVVVPGINLVKSICDDSNCRYEVQPVYGDVTIGEIKSYLKRKSVHKFAVTFDSLPKLMRCIVEEGYNLDTYKVLVDEFHTMLEDMGFRYKAINTLVSKIQEFKHYTFMSATPIPDEFLTSMFAALPYTEIEWSLTRNIKPKRLKTPNVYSALVKLIMSFKNGDLIIENYEGTPTKVEELYIFLNTVTGIKQVISNAGLRQKDVKIVCADTYRNSLVLGTFEVDDINSPNRKINFFTKTSFQGCNLFTNNGLIVAVSDGRKANTLIDIETTLFQISGRLRNNEKFNNQFKHALWHIYSTRRSIQSYDDFLNHMEENKDESGKIIRVYNNADKNDRTVLVKKLDDSDSLCYYDEDEDAYKFSELKEKYFYHNYKVANETYKNGLSIRDAYTEAGLNAGNQYFTGKLEDVILESSNKVGFKQIFNNYVNYRENEVALGFEASLMLKRIERENPLVKEAYEKLGVKVVNSCKFNEKKVKQKIKDSDVNLMTNVYQKVIKEIGYNKFTPLSEVIKIVQKIYDYYRIKEVAKSTILDKTGYVIVEKSSKRIDGILVKGLTLKSIK